MRARFGDGLVLTLGLADKEVGERERELRCKMSEWRRPLVVLHIVDEIKKRKKFLEEPWFHITGKPAKCGPEFRRRYDISITVGKFRELTNPQEDPVTVGGYIVSRSRYDRVDMMYFGI